MKNLEHDIHLRLSLQDVEMLDKIQESLGVRRTEALRWGIKELYWKMTIKSKASDRTTKDKLTQEEKCFQMGGDVIVENGRKFCRVLRGMGEVIDPLENL